MATIGIKPTAAPRYHSEGRTKWPPGRRLILRSYVTFCPLDVPAGVWLGPRSIADMSCAHRDDAASHPIPTRAATLARMLILQIGCDVGNEGGRVARRPARVPLQPQSTSHPENQYRTR
ncbi:unnamed protein product, partial [Iphiclides podalirius]